MSRSRDLLVFLGASAALLGLLLASVLIGPTATSLETVVDALTRYDAANDAHLVVREIRLPRTLLIAMVGASLAAAGGVMQGVTRNPLAGPSLMGLSGGGTLAVLVMLRVWPGLTYNGSIAAAFAGAALGYGCVLLVATLAPGGYSPTRLALAGAVTSSLLSALTQGLVIALGMANTMLYWTAGGVTNVTWDQVLAVFPCCLIGLAGVGWLAPGITVLSLGDDVATGLGQRAASVRIAATLLVLLLTGAAVAVAGPVAFVGLVTPHACRLAVGADYRRLLPLSMLAGAGLTTLADLTARTALGLRGELPLGVVTAVLGAPAFLWLLQRRRAHRLPGGLRVPVAPRTTEPARIVLPAAATVMLAVSLLALFSGRAELSPAEVARTLIGAGGPDETLVLWTFRVPRLLFALLVGAGIAISGTVLQSVLRNDLAEPGLIGVSSGAGLALVLVAALGGRAMFASVLALPLAGIAGGLGAALVVYGLCRNGEHSSPRLLLAGVAVSAVLGAVTLMASLLISAETRAFVVAYGAGSLNAAGWDFVLLLAALLALLGPLAWSFAPALNVLRLGDEAAVGLGVPMPTLALGLLALSVALCAACLSVAGGILFLGLIAPHIARRLVGSDHTRTIPLSGLIGATLLTLADLLGSRLLPSLEIPAGVMVSALGAPYFLYLMTRN